MYRTIAKYLQDQAIVIPINYLDHINILSNCITGTSDNFFFNPFLHLQQLSKLKHCQL